MLNFIYNFTESSSFLDRTSAVIHNVFGSYRGIQLSGLMVPLKPGRITYTARSSTIRRRVSHSCQRLSNAPWA